MNTPPRLLAVFIPVLLAACGSGTETPTSVTTSSQSRPSAKAAVTAESYHDVIQRFYLAYFGRPADVSGLDYWSVQYAQRQFPTTVSGFTDAYAGDAAIRTFVDFYGASKESTDLYAGDNAGFIVAVYRNLFSREPDAVGRAFWLDKLDRNVMTRPVAAFQIMRGAQGTDIDVINKKLVVAKRFTAALDTDSKRDAYDGLAANASVRAMLGSVGLLTDPTSVDIVPTLSALVAGLGAPRHFLNYFYGRSYSEDRAILPTVGGASVQGGPVGAWKSVVSHFRDTAVADPARHLGEPSISFWSNKRFYRQPMATHGAMPTPVLVSSLTQDELCQTWGKSFDDYEDDARSYRTFQHPGVDGTCHTQDDGYFAVRMDMASTTPAISIGEPLFATRSATGAISGFLVRRHAPGTAANLDVERVDAVFANARPAFTLKENFLPPVLYQGTLRRTGNMFVYRNEGDVLLWDADRATAGQPLTLSQSLAGTYFGDVLMADSQTLYVTASTTDGVILERYNPATGSKVSVAQLPASESGNSSVHMTANYVVLALDSRSIWVVPRAGGAARRLYQSSGPNYRDTRLQVAGERVWFSTATGAATIGTDGTGLVEYPGAIITGCVYRPGVSISANNDVCASMLLFQDNQLSGYNASSGALEVRYGAVPNVPPSVSAFQSARYANTSRGIDGQGMLFTRYSTSIINGAPLDLEYWHFIAGKPGLTRVVTP